jgi:hypothetical protein
MMLMQMKLDKSQVPSKYEYKASGAFSFTARDMSIMAGFTTYEALLVGASGGFAGNAIGSGTVFAGLNSYGAGPGGGGSLRLQEALKNLAAIENIVVGAVGADGASTSNNAPSGSGIVGGNTTFHGQAAYGGAPGTGDDWTGTATTGGNSGSDAGDGGGNSAGLGAGGVGGDGGWIYWDPSGSPDGRSTTAATAGTYVAGGVAPIIGGGKGGGGGPGLMNDPPGGGGQARVGASGASTALVATGGPIASNKGGGGGGADLFPLTGVHETYGNKGAGRNGQGALVIKLS